MLIDLIKLLKDIKAIIFIYAYACISVYCTTSKERSRRWRPTRNSWWSLWGKSWTSMFLYLRMNLVQARRRYSGLLYMTVSGLYLLQYILQSFFSFLSRTLHRRKKKILFHLVKFLRWVCTQHRINSNAEYHRYQYYGY